METLSDNIFTLRRDKEIGHPEDLLIVEKVKKFIEKDTRLIMKHFPMNASMIALMSDRKEIFGEKLT